MKTTCLNCQTPLEWDVAQYGETISCPSCNAPVQLVQIASAVKKPAPTAEPPTTYLKRIRAGSSYVRELTLVRIVSGVTAIASLLFFLWSVIQVLLKRSGLDDISLMMLIPIMLAAGVVFVCQTLADMADMHIDQNRKKG